MRRGIGLAALLFAVGCGGDDGEGQTVTETVTGADGVAALSKPQYIAKADAICRQYRTRTEELEDESQEAARQGENEIAAYKLQEALDLVKEEADQLEALPSPKGDASTLSELFDIARQGVALSERGGEALRKADYATSSSLFDEARAVTARARGIATGYGFKFCGQFD